MQAEKLLNTNNKIQISLEFLSIEHAFEEVAEINFYFDRETDDDDFDENELRLNALDDSYTVLD